MKMQVGIFNGTDLKYVSLQNINLINIMIGTMTLGKNHILSQGQIMEKFENYL